jgi:hypothetical protein
MDVKFSPVGLNNNKQRIIKIKKNIKIKGIRLLKTNDQDNVFYKRKYINLPHQ